MTIDEYQLGSAAASERLGADLESRDAAQMAAIAALESLLGIREDENPNTHEITRYVAVVGGWATWFQECEKAGVHGGILRWCAEVATGGRCGHIPPDTTTVQWLDTWRLYGLAMTGKTYDAEAALEAVVGYLRKYDSSVPVPDRGANTRKEQQ